MRRFLASFFVALILPFGCVWLYVATVPMAYMDYEYPIWRAKLDMARGLPPNSVVILGDSQAMAGLVSARLGPDVFNLAGGGATPMETYFLSRLLLSSANPPRVVLLSVSPLHCMATVDFWDHDIKYSMLDLATTDEFLDRSRRFNEKVLWTSEGPLLEPHDTSYLFGPVTPGDVDARLKVDLYYLHFPSFYFSALINAHVWQREEANAQTDRETRTARGFHSFGMGNGYRGSCTESNIPAFVPSPLLDSYLSQTVELFQEKNIPVYFIAPPFNETSVATLHPGFVSDYAAYIASYERRFPNFRRLGDSFPALPWTEFGDQSHLNKQGALSFSGHIADLLREAQVEK